MSTSEAPHVSCGVLDSPASSVQSMATHPGAARIDCHRPSTPVQVADVTMIATADVIKTLLRVRIAVASPGRRLRSLRCPSRETTFRALTSWGRRTLAGTRLRALPSTYALDMYDVALTVRACLQANTQVQVAWPIWTDGFTR